jgi:HD-GYP domain-containing protein (c-di-GMP phosphodiesterase class II)
VVAGFRLHDIGMIGIPAHVLSKPGPLTADELSEIREHPWLGERIVAPVEFLNGLARHVIGCHHERWDGTGYPRGLRGVEIPLPARIFAVADAYDAMTNAQPYRPALDPDAAVSEIEGKAATHFDPQVVTALLAWHAEQRDGS